MSTDTEKKETNLTQSIKEFMIRASREEKMKLIEKLWDYCKRYPNDSDLGKNLREFILVESMSN